MSRPAPFPFRDYHHPELAEVGHNGLVEQLLAQYEAASADENDSLRAAVAEDLLVDLLAVPQSLVDAYYWSAPTPAKREGDVLVTSPPVPPPAPPVHHRLFRRRKSHVPPHPVRIP